MPELTDLQARHLAAVLNLIRPDWPTASLLTLLWENREQPSYPALVIAAVTKAQDRTCKTPAPIFIPGAHWPEQVRNKLPALPRCQDHPEQEAPMCNGCWADVKAGHRPENLVGKRLNRATQPVGSTKLDEKSPAELIKANLRAANEARRAITREAPTEPPSMPKNENEAMS